MAELFNEIEDVHDTVDEIGKMCIRDSGCIICQNDGQCRLYQINCQVCGAAAGKRQGNHVRSACGSGPDIWRRVTVCCGICRVSDCDFFVPGSGHP